MPPLDGSGISGESTNHVTTNVKSTLANAEVMARYLLAKKKLRKDLKLKIMNDHQWHFTLEVLGHDFVGVVKVYCVECCKEFRSTTRDHCKSTIHNLFAKY